MGITVGSISRKVRKSWDEAKKANMFSLVAASEQSVSIADLNGTPEEILTKMQALRAKNYSIRTKGGEVVMNDNATDWGYDEKTEGFYRYIPCRLAYTGEHDDGGPPIVDETISVDDALMAVGELMDGASAIPPAKLVEILNNGLYLWTNEKYKVGVKTTQESRTMVFSEKASDVDCLKYARAMTKEAKTVIVNAWWEAQAK